MKLSLRMPWRWRIRTLMIAIAIVAVVFYGELLRRRRAQYLVRANQYAAEAQSLRAEKDVSEGEKLLARSEIQRAADRLAFAERMLKSGKGTDSQVTAEDLARQKAEFVLQQAQDRSAWVGRRLESAERNHRLYEQAAARPWLLPPREPLASPHGHGSLSR